MLMLLVSVVVLGVVALSRLPLLFLPTFDAPRLSVVVPYPFSAPEEIARLIIEPIEEAMGTVSHIERIVSQATATEGRVRLEFINGADIEFAAVDVRDRLDRVRRQLPDDVEHVFLRRFSKHRYSGDGVSRQLARPTRGPGRHHRSHHPTALAGLDGVADVQVLGLQRKTVQLQIDPGRLEAHGLTTYQLAALLRRNHVSPSGGSLEDGGVHYLLAAPHRRLLDPRADRRFVAEGPRVTTPRYRSGALCLPGKNALRLPRPRRGRLHCHLPYLHGERRQRGSVSAPDARGHSGSAGFKALVAVRVLR
jgi:multidrug efflux pump subunit AcrB